MTIQLIFERDEVFADLNRRATLAKDEGRIAEAVELLQQAKVRQGEAYEELRLALYLQAAGRVDEALAEIDWLIARAAEQVAIKASYLTAEAQCHASTLQLSRIHDKARLICQRAGRLDQAAHHSQLHDELERRLPALERSADRAEKAAAKKRKSLIQKEIQAQIRMMRPTHPKGKP